MEGEKKGRNQTCKHSFIVSHTLNELNKQKPSLSMAEEVASDESYDTELPCELHVLSVCLPMYCCTMPPANFICKEPDSKYFKFCGPHRFPLHILLWFILQPFKSTTTIPGEEPFTSRIWPHAIVCRL